MARSRRLVIGIASALGLALVSLLILVGPSYARYRARGQALEARAGVRALCHTVADYHRETGVWVAAGPSPAEVPQGGSVPFPPDKEFALLGFLPGAVRYQYQVVVEQQQANAPQVRCIARGDLDGDGTASAFELELDPSGNPGALRVENEPE
ncbi:MAG: hypothetical protein ACYC8T_08520 [Myxococcaceae bacterium]